MKFSIITPTWNQAAYIKDTIESVINQSHKDIEYLIIDNNSDDGTEDIVRSYMEKDPRIKYVREADHGQAEAINKGFNLATGDIVCWLNSDDYYFDNDVLAKVAKLFAGSENEMNDSNNSVGGRNKSANCRNIGIVVGDAWYCDKNKNLTEYNPSDRGVAKWVISRWYYIVQPSVFWKKTDLRLDEAYHYAFDWKFFIEMFGKNEVLYSHEPYSVYRMYEDNKTGQDNAKRKKEIYHLQTELGISKLNAAWCGHVYRVYEKAENSGKSMEWQRKRKARVDFFSRLLFHVTGKRICSF